MIVLADKLRRKWEEIGLHLKALSHPPERMHVSQWVSAQLERGFETCPLLLSSGILSQGNKSSPVYL